MTQNQNASKKTWKNLSHSAATGNSIFNSHISRPSKQNKSPITYIREKSTSSKDMSAIFGEVPALHTFTCTVNIESTLLELLTCASECKLLILTSELEYLEVRTSESVWSLKKKPQACGFQQWAKAIFELEH